MQPKLLDTVAILQDLSNDYLTLTETEGPSTLDLPSGLVGTIVHIYDETNPPQYLIEFADLQGCEYAMATLPASEFLVLKYELVAA